ncbi:MAG: N-acetylmuramoyl-L-alanine amidase [Syntrophomonas sp.]|nr:N-acetylmuramoyl-L-alanine amidase [Syntrophomonas sp.]
MTNYFRLTYKIIILLMFVSWLIGGLAGTSLSATTASIKAAFIPPAPTIIFNNQKLSFEVPPIIENGRTLVPLRAIFEAMGATVTWNETTNTVTATKGSTTVILPIASTTPTVNGIEYKLDVPAKIVSNRTLAPLRFVGEALGGNVGWDETSSAINIQAPEKDGAVVVAATVGKDTVNIRSGPNRTFASIDTALPGENLAVIGEQNGWYQVSRGAKTGWVAGWVVDVTWQEAVPVAKAPTPIIKEPKQVTTVPTTPIVISNSITGVDRKVFGNSGDNITISSKAPLVYTSAQTGTRLEIVLNNVLIGQAQSSYKYDSRMISSMGFQPKTVDSQVQTVFTLTTNKKAKFSIEPGKEGSSLNILLIDQSEIQPRISTVVLDAGHGGRDAGTDGYNLYEKDTNLAVVLKVGKILTQKGIKVVYTRKDDSALDHDTTVDLNLRSAMANMYNAALFVSVHCNAALSPDPSGTETYYYAPPEIPRLYIQKDKRSRLAACLQKSLVGKLGRNDRGVKQDNLSVLRQTTMPSALVELAFITNPVEGELLKQEQFTNLAAQAIADGIAGYIDVNINTNNVRP